MKKTMMIIGKIMKSNPAIVVMFLLVAGTFTAEKAEMVDAKAIFDD